MRTFKFAVYIPKNGTKHDLRLVDAIDVEEALDNAFAMFSREELREIAHRYGIPRVTGHDGSPVTDALGNPVYVSYLDDDLMDADEPPFFICLPCAE